MIYLDYAATTPMSDQALTIYGKAAKSAFGNSNSLHDIGGTSSQLLESSRRVIAKLINGDEKGLFFTGSGSEANILSIQSLLNGLNDSKKHLITSQIEHSSLYHLFKKLEMEGYKVTYLIPNKQGHIEINQVEKALRDDTGLVSIQHGNSEIGVVQNIKKIGELLKQKDIVFHSDCVQTFGKLPIDVEEFGLDAISISSHKIYGPKGIGAAYIKPSTFWNPVIPGTTHESGFRPGTVDVPAVAAFATASMEICGKTDENMNHYEQLRRILIDSFTPYQKLITIINDSQHCILPNIIPLQIKGIEGQYVMLECNRYGYAVSTGSACQVGMQEPSRTLLSIGYTKQIAKQYIRISLGTQTTHEQIENFAKVLINVVKDYYK